MPDIPVHVLLAVQASYHLLLKKNPQKCPYKNEHLHQQFKQPCETFFYEIILRPDILEIFY